MRSSILWTAALALGMSLAGATYPQAVHGEDPVAEPESSAHADAGQMSEYNLLQVMQHLGASQQQIQSGILLNNRLMVQMGAEAIAHHPIPKGGIAPYIKKNQAMLKSTIKAMDEQVHQTAVSMAEQASTGSMLELQELNDRLVRGCVGCHDLFRD